MKTLEAKAAAADDVSDTIELHRRIHELELELAETKLKLVDKDCQLEVILVFASGPNH